MKKKTLIIISVILLLLAGAYLVLAATSIAPSLNLNGLHQFTIQNYTQISGQNITLAANSTGGGYGILCITPDCIHRMYYNGTATIIE